MVGHKMANDEGLTVYKEFELEKGYSIRQNEEFNANEYKPPKIYIPDTSPAIVAEEPIEVAYSVTVDIKAYITRAVKSNVANIKKKDFVNIFSSVSTFIYINYFSKASFHLKMLAVNVNIIFF